MDNFFNDCPPMMADGFRDITDYKLATRRNEYIKYINDIYRDDEYRLFLQQTGGHILEKEWEYYKNNHSCWKSKCVHNYPTRMLPRHFNQEKRDYNRAYVQNINNKCAMTKKTCEKLNDYRASKITK
tara:strand:+ start:647 stop:1027 length:381 start_codon:yes stop_codon:yes gene_type:complete